MRLSTALLIVTCLSVWIVGGQSARPRANPLFYLWNAAPRDKGVAELSGSEAKFLSRMPLPRPSTNQILQREDDYRDGHNEILARKLPPVYRFHF